MSNPKQYWASLPAEELGPELFKRIEEYFRYAENTGFMRKLKKSYDLYYGFSTSSLFDSSSDVASGGEEGELQMVKVNHYRNLIQHILVMTTSSRPALEARAANTDMRSKAQTILANGILDYYLRDKRLERFLKTACEHSLLWGEGYIDIAWDTGQGEAYAVDPATGKPVYEGDVKYTNPIGPLDVIRDIRRRDGTDDDWKLVTEWVNKFDLAARYPELADEIIGVKVSATDARYQVLSAGGYQGDGNLVPLRKFYHRKTESMPNGRIFVCLSPTLTLLDGPMPYQNLPNGIPLYRITPAEFFGTPFGYSPAWDIIGLSEVHDSLYSVVVTNQTSFGVQNVTVPKGHDISYQQLTGGLNLIEYDPKLGKPEAMNLTHTPAEIFKFIEKLEKTEGMLLGLNDVVRGDPQASLKSGSALALVASQAIQFNSGIQASYVALLEDVGTATIRLLQTFANTKRVASIAGKSERFMLKEFSSIDIDQINRVVVDVANPLSRTISGRLEMAKDLLQIPGVISHADQYLQVIETGSYRSLTQGKEAGLLTIDSENEMLQEGQKPTAVLTDDHALHIKEHASVLAMPDSRLDPDVVKAVTDHMQEHANILGSPDPNVQRILVLTGQHPLPPPPQGPGQPQGPGPQSPPPQQHPPMPSGPQGPAPVIHPPGHQGVQATAQKAIGQASQLTADVNPTAQKAAEVRPVAMPKNPLSNQPFNPTTGGLPR